MNLPTIQPERAWQMALDQLQLEMPKAYFDTWVKNTEFVSFDNGLLTIGTANAYAREWLANRLTSTAIPIADRDPDPTCDCPVRRP